jgi:hypothetical protein
MKTFGRVLVGTAAAALVAGAVAIAPVRALDPPPEEPLARMADTMGRMHESMQQMQREMQRAPGMHAMQERMRHTMGMMEQTRAMMGKYREQMQRHCPGAGPGSRKDP